MIVGFSVAVLVLSGLGLVLIGLDAFRSFSRVDEIERAPPFRAGEAAWAAGRREGQAEG